MHPDSTTLARFWSKVNKRTGRFWNGTECWEWTGGTVRRGYGSFAVRGRTVRAHRFAYALAHGSVPPEVLVCHGCDNPPCIRPVHLFASDPAGNMADKVAKGRQARGGQIRNRRQQRGDDHWTRRQPVPTRGERNGCAKLTEADVRSIRAQAAAGVSQYRLAKEFGVSQGLVSKVVRRANWRHLP